MASQEVRTGLFALLVSVILTGFIIIPKSFLFDFPTNAARALLVAGFFFGLTLIVEHAVRAMQSETNRHPVAALLLVLLSSTVMLFSFMGLVILN